MIALFSDPIWAWCGGEHVAVFGIRTSANVGGPDDALVVTAEGKLEYRPLDSIQTEWRWDEKADRWVDDTPKGNDDDTESD